MTDEAPFRITLQAAVVGAQAAESPAIPIVCERRWPRSNSNEDFQKVIADVQLIRVDDSSSPKADFQDGARAA